MVQVLNPGKFAQVGDTVTDGTNTYIVTQECGEGANGQTFFCYRDGGSQILVIKLALKQYCSDSALERFETEYQATMALNSPNVVPYYDASAYGQCYG